MSQTQHTLISGSVMRLRHKAPFYSVLAMHAEWRADPEGPRKPSQARP